MKSDVLLFFGIIIFLFIVWVAEGGPSRPLSFAGPLITPTVATTSASLSRGPSASSAQSTGTLSRAQDEIVALEKSIVSSTRFGTPSPYKGMVELRLSGALRSTDEDQEYLSLAVSGRVPDAGIDITGWKIESEAVGHALRIPEGANLPSSGFVNPTVPIILGPGQNAIVVVGDSPIGVSFRENMCTGYLDQFQKFVPPLTHACPAPIQDFDRFYVGNEHSLDACRAYIKQGPSCRISTNPPSNLADDCWHFLDTYVNYNGCVATHKADKGFWGRTWRIYIGRDEQFFTKSHDTIKLLDGDGKTVDLVSY